MRRSALLFAFAPSLLALAGCDQLGIESASAVAARRDAEGKAIGAGCRHASRSVEQCFESNKRADKAAVFTGWREMNDYMRENKIDAQPAAADPAAADVAVASSDERADPGKAARGGRQGRPDKGEKAARSSDKAEAAGKGGKPADAAKAVRPAPDTAH